MHRLKTQAQNGIKNEFSTSNRPLMTSPKYRPKTRAQLTPLKGWQPKESILGENTQSLPIGKVRYFSIIAHQLSLINRFTCDAPKPGCPLTTRQPAEYLWMSGNPKPLTKIGQSLICTGSSTQGTNLSQQVYNDNSGSTCE